MNLNKNILCLIAAILTILFLTVMDSRGQFGFNNVAVVGSFTANGASTGGGGGGALLDDSLDYADSAAAVSAGWVNSASAPDWHYTTAPAPLGSYGYTSSFSDPSGLRFATHTFTPSDEVWVYFVFYTPLSAGNNYWIYLLDNSSNVVGQVRNISDTAVRAMNGTIYTGSSYSLTAGTKYVCFHWKKSTGGNGQAEVYISSTTTLGTAIDATTTGDATAQAAMVRIGFGNDNTVRTLYQRIKIYTTSQGGTFP